MKRFSGEIRIALLLFVSVCVLSIVYTLFLTLVGRTAMPNQANGSLLMVDGRVVGSEFIGQSFTSPGYFHSRPSAVDYNGANSGGSNYGATSARLMEQVSQRIAEVRKENNLPSDAPVPADLVLASGSGLDPHISVEGAAIQVPRIAAARGLPESAVMELVNNQIEPLEFGFLGQPRVNVLKLNLALDALAANSTVK